MLSVYGKEFLKAVVDKIRYGMISVALVENLANEWSTL